MNQNQANLILHSGGSVKTIPAKKKKIKEIREATIKVGAIANL